MGSALFIVTLLLAFCSIVYELLLGQLLSAFLGNTIVRYSVTVGLYMSSMGFGALLLPKRFQTECFVGLLKVELALSIIGSSAAMILLASNFMGLQGLPFSFLAHSLIVVIGVLTGFEIPLLIAIGNSLKPQSEARVLGVDYLGAFLGSVLFAFFFYPHVGIFLTAFIVGLINALAGLSLFRFWSLFQETERTQSKFFLVALLFIAVVLLILIANGDSIEQLGTRMYLQ
ncbi:MAG: hypothetical protein KDD64_01760 [Bdellovibrionales bacterium]|nr:hypothetical protein [Bdellovibrionales bacterium]